MATTCHSPPPSPPLLPPSPPATPPRVAFSPPLFLQRRTAVQNILRRLSRSSRFAGKLRSVLDVGCGSDCFLLRTLIPCEDDLPLERITGIDFDEDLFSPYVAESVAPGAYGGTGRAEDRWRALDVSLLQGSFVHLTPKTVPRHDIIVSTEVIEHLDPQPLSQFASVLLGRMKPKICVITTPNRDFNKVFDIPFTPLDQSPSIKPVVDNTALTNIGSIVEGMNGISNQPQACAASGHDLVEALKTAAKSLGDKIDRKAMSEDPPTCSSPFPTEPEPNTMPSDSESRYWRPGIPYPMRHHDHRFEWTRAEFRAWARTSAEQFGYDVSFTGVGGLDRGMNVIGGTGYAIDKSLEDAADEFPDRGHEGDTGEDMELGNELGDLFSSQVDGLSRLGRKARAVFGDCSQIAVFVIKKDIENEWKEVKGFPTTPNTSPDLRIRSGSRGEGTAEPIFADAWAPLMAPDNWFSLPYFTVPDIRLVCHYSYPWAKNEVFPPEYMHVIELMQATFIHYVPAMVLEEWQKTPATLIRERRARCAGIQYKPTTNDIDLYPYDFFEPPTAEVLQERKIARQEERECEARRIKEQTAVMGGMDPSKVEVVKMAIGSRKIWDNSYQLKRACHFHYDVFRRILASSAPEGVASYLPTSGSGDEGKWMTIIDTTDAVRNVTEPWCGGNEEILVQFNCSEGFPIVKATINASKNLYSKSDKGAYHKYQSLFTCGTKDIIFKPPVPHPALQPPTDPDDFWEVWDDGGDCASTRSDQEDYMHNTGDDQFGHWYHNDDDPQCGKEWKPLKLYTVAVWGIEADASFLAFDTSCKGKGKGKENVTIPQGERIHDAVRVNDEIPDIPEAAILRVGNNGKAYHGEEEKWDDDDVPLLMTWYKPQRSINYYEATEEGSYDSTNTAFSEPNREVDEYLEWSQAVGEELWRDDVEG